MEKSDLFLMGLLSLIDAMLEAPMQAVLEKIPLDAATSAVLLGQPSVLRPVFQLMLAHESGSGKRRLRRARGCGWTPMMWRLATGRRSNGHASSRWKFRRIAI